MQLIHIPFTAKLSPQQVEPSICCRKTFAHFTTTSSCTRTCILFFIIELRLTGLSNFGGVVLAEQEGKSIAEALGDKKAAILANHGLLTVSPSIEGCVAWFVMLENLCQSQMAADASSAGSGKPLVKIEHDEAQASWEVVGTQKSGYFQGLPLFQLAEREFGESTFLGQGLKPM